MVVNTKVSYNNGIKGDGKKPPRLMPVRRERENVYEIGKSMEDSCRFMGEFPAACRS